MKKIGLTGGIGSGKSTVAEIFRHMGVPVFNSDDAARKLQDEDEGLKKEIISIFGNEIYQTGKLDRAKLASIVFSDAEKLKQLNALVHPAVGKEREQFFRENSKAKYVIQEAAILFEIGLEKSLDGMIVVTAPDEIRIQRVMDRDKVSRDDVLLRLKNQMPQEEKVKKADYVIQNDGINMLVPQVIEIDKKIVGKSGN